MLKQFKTTLHLMGWLIVLWIGMPMAVYAEQARVKGLEVNLKGDLPKVCLQLSHQLKADFQFYADYIELQARPNDTELAMSKQAVAPTMDGDKLCLTELKYGHSYKVTLRTGFLFTDSKLEQELSRHFSIKHRSPIVQFQTATYVLPASQKALVPLEVLNVDKLHIKVLRLSPEQVKQQMEDGEFFSTLSGYAIDSAIRNSQLVGEQDISLNIKKNKITRVNLDLSKVLSKQKPGAFYLIAQPDKTQMQMSYYGAWPVQKIIYTDVGLVSYQAKDGLHVYARSYRNTQPIIGAKVQLIAKNHDVLAVAVTNKHGKASFHNALMQGLSGHKPVQVRVVGSKGQMAVLDLEGQALDLSDRPIGGKEPLGLLNAYLFSERGVYRLGEQAVVTGIVRDQQLNTPVDLPLTFKLIRPNGDVAISRPVHQLQKGGFQQRFNIPTSGRTGQWLAALYLNVDEAPIGQVNLEVADYVPETIAVNLEGSAKFYNNKAMTVRVASDFLYGAPAADLSVSAKAVISKKSRLFKQYPAYIFGTSEKWQQSSHQLADTKTDEHGQAIVVIPKALLKPANQQQPTVLNIRIGVEEPSGRIAQRNIQIPASQFDSWVGIKTASDAPVYDEDKSAYFNLINIATDQQVLSHRTLSYKVIKEEWDYHWYYSNGRWSYRVDEFDKEVIAQGEVKTDERGIANIEVSNSGWGRYRLEVKDVASGQITHLKYRKGWWNPDGAQSAIPDNVKLAPSTESVRAGDIVKLQVNAPYSGKLHLIVANEQILEERFIDLTAGKALLKIKAEKSWGNGVYFLATVYRAAHKEHGPARAIGISYVALHRPELDAKISIKGTEQARPGKPYTVKVDTDLAKGSQLVLALVDEGILQLTQFKTPKPKQWFLAKRKLALETRDLYGHLIQHKPGEVLRLHFGADADGGAATAPPMDTFVKPTALVSKLITVDEHGDAEISFDLPQFNGRLRMMAVAFDERAIGSTQANVIVKNPIVVQPQLPRFLALEDSASIGVSLHNMELAKTNVSIEWQVTDGLELSRQVQTVNLERGQRQDVSLRLWGLKQGLNQITLQVTPEHGESQTYQWDMTVVNNRFVEQHMQQLYVPAGDRSIIASKVGPLIANTRQVELLVTNSPELPTKWIVDSLGRYPLGCLEQTTSKAWPMLFAPDTAGALTKAQRETHIQRAVEHLATMQLSNGAFSLWSGGYRVEKWLTMYALDFLLAAQHKGYSVPSGMLSSAKSYVSDFEDKNAGVISYALYLQTKIGTVDPGELRYVTDKVLNAKFRPQVYAHLLAAHDLLGNKDYVAKIIAADKGESKSWWRSDYGTDLRDRAMMYHTLLQGETVTEDSRADVLLNVQSLFEDARNDYWLSTQEKAWLLRLADTVGASAKLDLHLPISLDFKDQTLSDMASYLKQQNRWTNFKNISEEDMYLTITSTGINTALSLASHNEITINTSYKDMVTGKTITLDKVALGVTVLVQHEIEIPSGSDQEISIEAPVPAGFELENPRLSGHRPALAKLPRTEPQFEEFRDDRYLAAWSLSRGYNSLKNSTINISYVMRAVTAGDFLLPAIRVEDMYRPRYRANTAEGRVLIGL